MKERFRSNWKLIPLIFILGFEPLIVYMKQYSCKLSQFEWFADFNEGQVDFFLKYKSYAMIAAGITVLVIMLLDKKMLVNRRQKIDVSYGLLAGYLFLVFLSSLFSPYRSFAFAGLYELQESFWVVCAYVLTGFYCYLYIDDEKKIKTLIHISSIGVMVELLIATMQGFGYDIFRTTFGKMLITPPSYWSNLDQIIFSFDTGTAYGTLYNPDYIGFYVGIWLPVCLVMLYWAEKKWQKIWYVLLAVLSVTALVGSRAISGIIAMFLTAVITILVLLSRDKKKLIVGFLIMVLLAAAGLFVGIKLGLVQQLWSVFTGTFKGYDSFEIQRIETGDEDITIYCKDTELHVSYTVNDAEGGIYIMCKDAAGNELDSTQEIVDDQNIYVLNDAERYHNCRIRPLYIDDYIGIELQMDNLNWYFTNQYGDGTYYYYNFAGKFVKIEDVPDTRWLNDNAFQNRGLIWNHTFPLLKHYIIFGAGSNNYGLVYPQNDYIYKKYMNQEMMYDVKAHNWYLQQWVEDGLVALLLFLAFLAIYFVKSVKNMRHMDLRQPLCLMQIAVFFGVISYAIAAFVNDSNVNTTPTWWVMIGLGIVMNRLVEQNELNRRKSDENV